MTLYDVLKCDAKATENEIRQAYLRLARAQHPDRGGSCQTFAQISAAWRVLGSTESRHIYDASLVLQSTVLPVHAELRTSELPLDTETGMFCLACRCGGTFSVHPDDLCGNDNTQPMLVPCDNCSLYIRVLDVT